MSLSTKVWLSFLKNNVRRIRFWVSRCLWLCRSQSFCASHVWKRDVSNSSSPGVEIINMNLDQRMLLETSRENCILFWFNKELWLLIQEALTKQEQFPENHFRTDRLRIISRMKGNNNKLLSLLREENQKRRKFPGKYSREILFKRLWLPYSSLRHLKRQSLVWNISVRSSLKTLMEPNAIVMNVNSVQSRNCLPSTWQS